MKRLFFILLVILLTWGGCVTSQGDLFEKVTGPAPEKESSAGETPSEEEDGQAEDEEDNLAPGIEINTRPSGGDVWFNGVYQGRSSVFIDNPNTGVYLLEVRKEGYYPLREWVSFQEDTCQVFTFYLEEIQGYLDMEVLPEEADIWADGDFIDSFPAAFQIGPKNLEVSLFGYTTWRGTVDIRENETTRLKVTLEEAPFAVGGVLVSKSVFSPDNPGPFGRVKVLFTVDNRGTGEVLIQDHQGTLIRTITTEPFTRRDQSITWDGLDEAGRRVPDGMYTLIIRGRGEKGTLSEASSSVLVDRDLVIRQRNLTSGYAGLLYCPTPDTLDEDNFQISVSAMGLHENDRTYVPVQGGFRFPLPADLEGVFQATLLTVSLEDDGYSAGLSVKVPLSKDKQGFFSHALGLKATYQGVRYTDTLTNFTGLSLCYPLALAFGPVSFYLAPEGVVSFNTVDYDTETVQTPGFYLWAYGRFGLSLELPWLTVGFSGAARTTPFFRAPVIHLPLAFAGEVNIYLPETQFFCSLYGLGEFSTFSNYYLLFGGGIHFLF
ncbi:MAG: PEGA domain-containing protein [Spirochaetales bacterium]|nr:PEGA domain-containing protein [Spirochaetales bacterium]